MSSKCYLFLVVRWHENKRTSSRQNNSTIVTKILVNLIFTKYGTDYVPCEEIHSVSRAFQEKALQFWGGLRCYLIRYRMPVVNAFHTDMIKWADSTHL